MKSEKESIMIFVTKKEKEAVKKRVEAIGLRNMSAYIRMLIHRDLKEGWINEKNNI